MDANEFWCRAYLAAMGGQYAPDGEGVRWENHGAPAVYCEAAANAHLAVAQRRGMVTGERTASAAVCQAALDSIRGEPDGDMRLAVELGYQASMEPRGPRREVMRLASDRLRALARPVTGERTASAPAAEPAPDVLGWLYAQENPQSWGPRFGAWRPSSGEHQGRRFHAKRVEYDRGVLWLVGEESGPDVRHPVRVIMRDWIRVDAAPKAAAEPELERR